MYKYIILFMIASVLLGCKKHNQQTGCPSQACTLNFASLYVNFVDKDGQMAFGKDVKVVNLRTKQTVIAKGNPGPPSTTVGPHLYTIATDNNKNEFSTEGDDVELTVTNIQTGATQTALFKISGGCNCHIAKVSGPATIVLN
ncbi:MULTISPECIES: hypothetical protein [Mucilaginibacter]|uniref:hypothetical protein n=1 Tax=Mucilaginibacter TaxID=423349 RepID=UPI0008712128|nr:MULTISPECIES: hypothetical protein [Mucilaginibacter]NVM63701.1 hypothetical protein [Mucilaginibacter sp. SG538B]GGB25523.1 hypothetical protein GCM10011500_47200 [Mucilaginibacter rubeus]SCW68566.1 hypothetical protein SAMN03159284_02992 [Mucilaginibacter sp. NFR10]